MISYVTPYYENAGMLREQLSSLFNLGLKDLDIQYIVVDDGSPKTPASEVFLGDAIYLHSRTSKGLLKLFRIEEDVRWNHIAARNIGVRHARHEWLMLTDMDHVVPRTTFITLEEMIKFRKVRKDTVYTFDRFDTPALTAYKPHPHTWFMHRDVWDKFKGYDERFSGHYGMDFLARERLKEIANFEHLNLAVYRYPREHIPDASTTNYERKSPEDRKFVKQLRAKLRADGSYWDPLTLSFPYHEVFTSW